MPEMDGSSRPPQISEMFQKFALAFKAKTFDFFADEESAAAADGFSLLDSAEEVITDQKVVVIKPDSLITPTKPDHFMEETQKKKNNTKAQIGLINTQPTQTLISSIFATVSSFEASYLQLQTAHVPFVEESIKSADRALVSHLQRLSELKRFYIDYLYSDDGSYNKDLMLGSSCLEAQVEENQSKLRTLGTFSDRLQQEMDQKDNEVAALRKKLEEIQRENSKLSNRLSGNSDSSREVFLSIKVFDSVLVDACRVTRKFTKILIELMNGVGWDLDLAANLVHPNIEYAKKGHNKYAFLSYVFLGMFRNFDFKCFGLVENGSLVDGHVSDTDKTSGSSLRQLLEHVSSNPMEVLSRDRDCDFSRFCEGKYQEIIHPAMESSIFSNLDRKEVVLNSWRSLSVFYEAYVNMASSVWTLHKLAFSFDPVVEIFQLERGVDFSIVYMEDVTKRLLLPCKSRAKVGFTVVPGFKIGRTVIQSQVYLTGLKCTEEQ